MPNKTILMIAYYFPPAAGIGTFRITKFAKYLKKKGYNPIIVTVDENNYLKKDNSLLKDLKDIPRYNIKLLNKDSNSEKDFYFSLLKQLSPIVKEVEPSYAFITGGPFYYLKIGPILYEKYKIKYIVDLRDPWSLQKTIDGNILKKCKNLLYKKYAGYLENKIFKEASYITTVNDTMTTEYRKKFPKYKNKIVTIPNAMDLDDYKNEKPHKFSNFTIIYSGKFLTSSGFRNPKPFLEALKKINYNQKEKIHFIHVGAKEKVVEDLVNEMECQDFVEFYGMCPYRETISYCKGADILLVLSTEEKCEQTGKIYDYIGCDRNILAITNKNNEIYKICKKNNISVASPNNVLEIEKTILKLYNSESPNYSKDNIETREKMTEKLIALIEQIK